MVLQCQLHAKIVFVCSTALQCNITDIWFPPLESLKFSLNGNELNPTDTIEAAGLAHRSIIRIHHPETKPSVFKRVLKRNEIAEKPPMDEQEQLQFYPFGDFERQRPMINSQDSLTFWNAVKDGHVEAIQGWAPGILKWFSQPLSTRPTHPPAGANQLPFSHEIPPPMNPMLLQMMLVMHHDFVLWESAHGRIRDFSI